MKRIVNILFAASLVLTLTVSAMAADYGSDPSYVPPVVTSNEIIMDNTITEALKSDKPEIKINGKSAELKVDAIAEIAKGDKPVTFITETYSVIIDPKDITDNAKAINLAMDISVTPKGTPGIPTGAIVIQPAASGDFGFALTVVIPAETVKATGKNTSALKAFYIADDGKVSQVDFVINSDGSISLKISHASSYVITDEDLLVEEDTEEEDTDEDGTEELIDDEIPDEDDFGEDKKTADDVKDNDKNVNDDKDGNEIDNEKDSVITTITPETTSNNEKNPSTGVVISFTFAGISGLAALVAKKIKK